MSAQTNIDVPAEAPWSNSPLLYTGFMALNQGMLATGFMAKIRDGVLGQLNAVAVQSITRADVESITNPFTLRLWEDLAVQLTDGEEAIIISDLQFKETGEEKMADIITLYK